MTVAPTTTIEDALRVSYDPVPKRVLLLIPEEFSNYSFTNSSATIAYKLGPKAAALLPAVMARAFSAVDTRSVSGEGALLVATDPKNPDMASHDYVAYPKFVDTKVTRRGGPAAVAAAAVGTVAVAVETTIRIEFVAVDRSRSIATLGHGVGTGIPPQALPNESAPSEALRTAFRNLLGDITTKRTQF